MVSTKMGNQETYFKKTKNKKKLNQTYDDHETSH